ncbi:AraC family transcriptional regulator [Sphingobium sufflavum]|uniref:AraC family transcriptional regulator n=1 Tax=Sphingobium sufflavum TaxID=1129547 RepID=UPI001F45B3DA|nr:AraC family transcriptional regulator [Sphingobium sufflavum]MCE7796862.1 AraC family transcriptional regulator [Sphingobium sufflavum]
MTEQGDDSAFEMVQARTLALFPELVRDLGGDPDAMMQAVEIDPATLDGVEPRVRFRAMIALLELAAAELACPDFGMRLAVRQRGAQVFGPLGVVMRNAATLGAALRYAATHMQAYSLAGAMPMERNRESRRVFVGMDFLLDNVPLCAQAVEQVLLLAHLNAVEITGGRARVRRVYLRYRPVLPLRVYRQYFGCEVLFDQQVNGIVFTEKDMAAPVVDSDAEQHAAAARHIEAAFPDTLAPMHARVRGRLMRHLGLSDCGIGQIADALCLHPRTLHRRLQAEGKTFEEVKDEVRRDVAHYYLARTDMPVTRIAEKLGYAETSVLSRSCQRWFGASPRRLRAQVRDGGPA